MKTSKFMYLATVGLAAACTSEKGPAVDGQSPNLLYIFPDQYRMTALGIWSNPEYRNLLNTVGDPVHTPNLDRLASEGVVFTDVCSTHPVSSPYRAMMMSGMYPHENGVEDYNCHAGRTQGLRPEITCFTDVLAQAGYETAYVGKTHWHRNDPLFDEEGNYVGTEEAPGGYYMNPYDTYIPEGPSRHGNKFWFQQLKDSHFDAVTYSNRPELVGGKKDGEPFEPHRFTTEVEADVIIRYLENKHGERDASRPFSLIWSINPPHNPYYSENDCEIDVFNEFYRQLTLDEIVPRPNVDKTYENLETCAKVYFSLITSVDKQIGRVLDCLEKIGEKDNTLVVFTSDHGEMMGSHDQTGKNLIYDEAFRIPFLLRYPAKLAIGSNDLMLGSVDVMPTLLGLMGLGDRIPSTVMGCNYSDGILTGTYSMNPKPKSALYLKKPSKGVRTYRYSYVVFSDGTYELYDNQTDPYQMHTLALESLDPETADMLKTELGKWLKTSHDGWYAKRMLPELVIYPQN